VHRTDTVEDEQADEPAEPDSTSEDKATPDISICYAPANIEVSSLRSTHREDQELWAPLVTLTGPNPGHSSPFSPQKQLKDTMGSATVAITSATTTTPAITAATTSRTGTGGTGSGTTPSRTANPPDVQDIRDTFDAALR